MVHQDHSGLQVRAASAADLPALTAIYNHYVENSAATFDIEPSSVEQRRSWFARYSGSGPYRLLVAVAETGVLGYASSSQFRAKPAYSTSVEVSVYCHPQACGRGIGQSLYTLLFNALETEGIHRAYAGITLPNDASVALHCSFGFTDVGVFREVGRKFGRYWDVLWMQLPMKASTTGTTSSLRSVPC
jgi:phosphinothricin acetyltransferase